MTKAHWAEPFMQQDVVHHSFVVQRQSGPNVPGVAWYAVSPSPSGPAPVVLLGHGGRDHKTSDRMHRLATRLVGEHGFNVVAIDGPFHGERSPGPGFDYQAAMAAEGVEVVTDRVVQEWLDMLEAIDDHPALSCRTLGYLGFSQGSRFGLPLVAELGPRLRGAVLGRYGLRPSGMLHPGLDVEAHTLAAAGRVTQPVLFHAEWEDEIFPRDAQVALFDALASDDKTLYARNGRHGSSRPEDETTWLSFLARHLR